MSTAKPSGAPAPAQVGAAQAIRDVFIASINKGQFPFAVVGAILALLLMRVPQEDIVPLIKWMVETVGSAYYLGYLLFVATVFAWYFHAQRVRKEFSAQFDAFRSGQKVVPSRQKGASK
ncbi:hypothetical protein FSY59_00565 [Comamonas sp. Z3]|uniref:hypothetical protein n=1 Tax=Comamonas sp. Z3 TaxID=2601247 RepID=UPI0011E7EA94|nr:hypothetical protein [Comamonas sp. Z3]TYK73184.1 hypothetical protein FSY59_00565 [Comamonas sp. Z3]